MCAAGAAAGASGASSFSSSVSIDARRTRCKPFLLKVPISPSNPIGGRPPAGADSDGTGGGVGGAGGGGTDGGGGSGGGGGGGGGDDGDEAAGSSGIVNPKRLVRRPLLSATTAKSCDTAEPRFCRAAFSASPGPMKSGSCEDFAGVDDGSDGGGGDGATAGNGNLFCIRSLQARQTALQLHSSSGRLLWRELFFRSFVAIFVKMASVK